MTKIKITPLSKLLVCSSRWVRDLTNKGILPRPVNGFFILEEVVPKYVSFLRSSSLGQEYQKLRSLHLGQKIEKLKIETKLIEKAVVPANYAQEILKQAGVAFEQAYKVLPIKLARILAQIRKSDESNEVYEKFVAVLLDRSLKDMVRHSFFGVPVSTPLIRPWEIELLSLGVVEPDSNGNVFYCGEHGKTLMKATDVIKRGEAAVQRIKQFNQSINVLGEGQ